MKGISHFAIGLAAASCFPAAVRAGAEGNPLYFILAGIFGLLPDTLDFKFIRFLYKSELGVIPDPLRPDAQPIADAVALAVARAHAENRNVNVKLNTIKLAADRWQRYQVRFDVPGRRVCVSYGLVVDTGGNPIRGAVAPVVAEACVPLPCGIEIEYLATTDVDIFDGPVYRMEPTRDGRVRPVFIPWHRNWTHSFVTAFIFGLAGAAIWDAAAGGVIFAAFAAHALADQLGYLGSNLFAPFSRRRTPGLKLMHATWALPNFAAVWLSGLLIFWNLARDTTGGISGMNPLRYVFFAGALPLLAFALMVKEEPLEGPGQGQSASQARES